MKMKIMLAAAVASLTVLSSAHAEVRTFQGSTRWSTTYFTPGMRTAASSTSYTTYYIVEIQDDVIVDALKIDAWTTKTGSTTQRKYYVDHSFDIDYGFFGVDGRDVAGGIKTNALEATQSFRGTLYYGDLGAFTLYPTTDYYPNNGNLDVIAVNGSARINNDFSGIDLSLAAAANRVMDHLESRGYYEVN